MDEIMEHWEKFENYVNANIEAWIKDYNLTDVQVKAIYDSIEGLKALGFDPASLPDYNVVCPC